MYVSQNLLFFNQHNMHGRLANTLLYLSKYVYKKKKFDVILSRVELSNLCRISRENLIKILYEFNKEGLIKLNGKQIEILKPDELKRLTEVC
jgi:CRP/FNR family transcriptional regulator